MTYLQHDREPFALQPHQHNLQPIPVLPPAMPVLESGYLGVSPSGKAAAFGAAIRGFESLRPSLLMIMDSRAALF